MTHHFKEFFLVLQLLNCSFNAHIFVQFEGVYNVNVTYILCMQVLCTHVVGSHEGIDDDASNAKQEQDHRQSKDHSSTHGEVNLKNVNLLRPFLNHFPDFYI